MSLSGACAIAGVYEHPTRWAPDKTELQIMAECARGALDDAGLAARRTSTGSSPPAISMGAMGIVELAEYLNIKPRYLDGTNIGGSSFVAHVSHAAAAIHAGLCEVALILYGSTAASNAMAIGTGRLGGTARSGRGLRLPYGMTTVGSYALVAAAHMQTATAPGPSSSPRSRSRCAVTPAVNPAAKMRARSPWTTCSTSRIDLGARCTCSTAASSATAAAPCRDQPRARPGSGQAAGRVLRGCGEVGLPPGDRLARPAHHRGAGSPASTAFAMAGVGHDDIDLCTIYDSFTITVLVTLENLGFCKPGEGGAFVSDGRIGLGGALPVNPDGGGLSSNHPGMRGIFLVIEAVRQLRGEPRRAPGRRRRDRARARHRRHARARPTAARP